MVRHRLNYNIENMFFMGDITVEQYTTTAHNVAIGTNMPTAKLEGAGEAIIDGAAQQRSIQSRCAAITPNNLNDEGTYTLAVQEATSRTSSFATTSLTFNLFTNNNGAY